MEACAKAAWGSQLEAVAAATAWSGPFVTVYLDPASRLGLSQACKVTRQWVLEAAKEVTVALLAHGGLSDGAWQRRLTSCAGGLALRDQPAKLLLRVPVPDPALQSVVSMPAAAGRAITELEVRQCASAAGPHGVHTPWLSELPAAFPNLRTLRLSRLCGCMPPAPLLPHLKDLSVHLCPGPDAACSIEALSASIAPYVPQLSALAITKEWASVRHGASASAVPWSKVFTAVSTSLRSFTTDDDLTQDLAQLLRTFARHAGQINYKVAPGSVRAGTGATWAADESLIRSDEEITFEPWYPRPKKGLVLLPGRGGVIRLHFPEIKQGGLSKYEQYHLRKARFTAPCQARVGSRINTDEPEVAIEAALRQLSALPPGSIVQIDGLYALSVQSAFIAIEQAVDSAGPAVSHLTILPPPAAGGDDNFITWLCQLGPHLPHACVSRLWLDGAVADVPWPWQSLRATSAPLSQLLYLPNPSGGQYDIQVLNLEVDTDQWTFEVFAHFQLRLQHWTFLVGSYLTIELRAPQSPDNQPAALQRALGALSGFRWRREVGSGPCTLILRGWRLTAAVIRELRALPTFDFPARLTFRDCTWPPTESLMYLQLPALVPTCYSTWCFDSLGCDSGRMEEPIMAVCAGAHARGVGCAQLSLVVNYTRVQMSDTQRSVVEAYVEELEMGRWLGEIKWVLFPEGRT